MSELPSHITNRVMAFLWESKKTEYQKMRELMMDREQKDPIWQTVPPWPTVANPTDYPPWGS